MDDPVRTNPNLYSTVFENERVRVLRYIDQPGDLTKPHDHPDSVMITLSTFDRRLHHEGGEVDVHMENGLIRWLDAQRHAGENIGTTETNVIFVELKEPGPAKNSPVIGPR